MNVSHPLPQLGHTGYTVAVAKVMISLPDDLLHAVDSEAERRGTTRSGYLRELAEESIRRRSAIRAARIADLRRQGGPPLSRGGDAAGVVKAHRPA